MMLMTISEVPHPETNSEFVFAIVNLLSGVLIIAIVVGNVGMMFARGHATASDYQHRTDALKTYLAFHKVSKHQPFALFCRSRELNPLDEMAERQKKTITIVFW